MSAEQQYRLTLSEPKPVTIADGDEDEKRLHYSYWWNQVINRINVTDIELDRELPLLTSYLELNTPGAGSGLSLEELTDLPSPLTVHQ